VHQPQELAEKFSYLKQQVDHAMAEASDFKFGTQLGFAKAHYKITPRRKVGMALG